MGSGLGIGDIVSCLTSSELSVLPAQYQIKGIDGASKIRVARINGRNPFHVRAIRRSYRIRGRVPRIQIKA